MNTRLVVDCVPKGMNLLLVYHVSASVSIAVALGSRTSLVVSGRKKKTAILHDPNPNPIHIHRFSIHIYEEFEPVIPFLINIRSSFVPTQRGKEKEKKRKGIINGRSCPKYRPHSSSSASHFPPARLDGKVVAVPCADVFPSP